MASTSYGTEGAWEKHFTRRLSGGGMVDTVLRNRIDIDGIEFSEGAPVTVIGPEFFAQSPRVAHIIASDFVFSVPMKVLMKPCQVKDGDVVVKLKPQNFKSLKKSAEKSVSEMVDDLVNEISKIGERKIKHGVRSYLIALLDYWQRPSSTKLKTLKQIYVDNETHIKKQLNSIENDFGEIIAAIAIATNGDIESRSTALFKGGRIEFPSSGSAATADFVVFDKDRQIQFSSKRNKGLTNTLKPDSIVSLLQNSGYDKKWAKTELYTCVDILRTHSVVQGPLLVREFMKRHENLQEDERTILTDLIGEIMGWTAASIRNGNKNQKINTELVRSALSMGLLGSTKTASNTAITRGAIFPLFEQETVRIMNRVFGNKVSEIFYDALDGTMHIVSFGGITKNNPQGKVSMKINVQDKAVESERAAIEFRGKNDHPNRANDRIGIQPKM